MDRRRRTSIFEDLVELASRLPWWVVLSRGLISYLHFHAYAISPLPAVAESRQMRQHPSSSMFRGTATARQCGHCHSSLFLCVINFIFANKIVATPPGR